MQCPLEGRVAVVTGGSGDLGLAMAQALADAGASIVLASRDLKRLESARARMSVDDAHVWMRPVDVTDAAQVRSLMEETRGTVQAARHPRERGWYTAQEASYGAYPGGMESGPERQSLRDAFTVARLLRAHDPEAEREDYHDFFPDGRDRHPEDSPVCGE